MGHEISAIDALNPLGGKVGVIRNVCIEENVDLLDVASPHVEVRVIGGRKGRRKSSDNDHPVLHQATWNTPSFHGGTETLYTPVEAKLTSLLGSSLRPKGQSCRARKPETVFRQRSFSSTCGIWLEFSKSTHSHPLTRSR